ncbi:flagellar brake protein [Ornithinibacillus contaminans]|uniref:flagellar brake protein n=1 Tax=Ornithinibacillus contaminans TaxID=694055 RepID=UPI00064D7523|nr:PilZ domain-containing protein [Ornithinibacillus contaminans]
MKIGAFLTLEVFNAESGANEMYRCKIIDKNKKYLFIDYPVHVKTKRTQVFTIGTYLSAEYIEKDQSIYRFNTIIKEKRKGKIPALALRLPEKEQIQRIQRRQYVRVETAVDVAIHSTDDAFAPFSTVTVDISGGGLSIVVPKGVQLNEDVNVTLYVVLHMHSGDYQYLTLSGKVVRIIEDERKARTASVKLLSIDSQEQQEIIRYCFEKQREARQKEMK